jgi:glutamyl-tRNA synthetase
MSPVRVRFAPSPTGYLHVGGARTAIFNWLFARHHGGSFLLRIEDTDVERSSEPMVAAITDGLAWLDLRSDEPIVRQSLARERHVEDAGKLLASGHAYRCFCSREAIESAREQARVRGESWIYPRTCVAVAADEADRRVRAGEPSAVRFRASEGRVEWNDLVHGPTGFGQELLEDFVLLRSDGTPTYMLSVVSDDVAMGITHVIRGEDHLSNTPKQILLYRALGRPVPEFGHLPLILGPDKKRLSKRHGAVSLLEYRDRGFLPEAMFNFLALLGWSPPDGREKMSRQELEAAFDLARVGRSGAVFDLQKLEWLNGQHLNDLPADRLTEAVRPRLEAADLWRASFAGEERAWFERTLALLRPRARTLDDFVEHGRAFFDRSDELDYDPAAGKHLKVEGLASHLGALIEHLDRVEQWEPAILEEALRAVATGRGVAAGTLIHPTRLALTGKGVSPGIFEVLESIGRERSLARLRRLLARLNGR